MRIALFITCLTDTLFPEAGRAVVAVLERLGHQVDFPEEQACCGQMHFNTGYPAPAARMLAGFVRAFADAEVIVTPSASCAAMIREYYPGLAGAGPARIAGLSRRVYEFSEFLDGVLQVSPEQLNAYFPHTVTYHPSCHGLRMLGIGEAPVRLLRGVRGLTLRDLPDAETCCGFGGTFAVKNADVSAAMCADKVAAIRQTRAEVVTATDSSCLMHVGGALSRQRTGVRAMHIAEILASTDEDVTGGRRP